MSGKLDFPYVFIPEFLFFTVYPPHLAVGDFLGWLEHYEAEHGPNGPNASPLHIPPYMRRKMQVIFTHPVYAAILLEQLQDIRRPIYYLGSPDDLDYHEAVNIETSDDEGGASDPGDGDVSSSSQSGSSDSGVCNGEGLETGGQVMVVVGY